MAASKMILYVYEHCPYCVIARTVFGIKKIPFDLKIISNADEETPKRLIGKKMVPILVKPDGTAMGESLDIVRWVDDNVGEPMIAPASGRTDLNEWITANGMLIRTLLFPRFVNPVFDEFADEESRAFFTKKKEERLGFTFSEALTKSTETVAQLQPELEKLNGMVKSETSVNGANQIGLDDIVVFGHLRGLTLVKGIVWPAKLRAFLENTSHTVNVPLLEQYAS